MNKKMYLTPSFESEMIVSDFLMSSIEGGEVEWNAEDIFKLADA